ncbi:MAG: zinc ribbon domain-containing protein [Acidobacteriota bacterium]|nr:zinc ribbon domain-containing protein [Acidobacteriota bacterium]
MQCATCGYEIGEGKKFCRQCGAATPAPGHASSAVESSASALVAEAVASVTPTSVAEISSPSPSVGVATAPPLSAAPDTIACPKCGKALAAGKKFCSGCGAQMQAAPVAAVAPPEEALPEADAPTTVVSVMPEEPVMDAPVPEISATVERCENCGAEVSAGNRLCEGCQSVLAAAVLAPPADDSATFDRGLQEERGAPPVEDFAMPEPASTSVAEEAPPAPDSARPEPITPAPGVPENPQSQRVSATPLPVKKKAFPVLPVIAACVLVAVAVGVVLLKRAQHSNAVPAAPVSVTQTATPAQPKPDAGTVSAPQGTVQTGALTPSIPPSPATPTVNPTAKYAVPQPHVVVTPPPAPPTVARVTPPPTAPAPAAPSSGMLHYSGAPLHFGEYAEFDNLPAGRLHFTFDESSWQPLLSRRADGTKILKMRSTSHDVQTRCDVKWTVIP